MTDVPSDLSIAERVDAVCDQFEREFRAGYEPRLESYLSVAPESLRAPLFRTLLDLELELRQNQGQRPQIADYEARFPELLEQIGKSFEAASQPASMISSVKLTGIETSQGPNARKLAATKPRDGKPLEKLGRFEIRSVLGEGAFGTVYRARDPQLDREVAVKVPHFSIQQSREDRQRFLREARAAAGLHHANICPVHEVGSVDGHDYIVLAFIDGKPLSKVLQSKPQLSDRQIVAVIRKIALALQEAHDKGIVHRDLKPANIMINRKGEPVIMDFGLARRSNTGDAEISQSGQIMGTPAYMSPEQARGDGKSVGPASDVYSLGIVLYELLCGRRPFEGTVTEVIGQILHVDAPPPAQFRPEVDLRLQEICLKSIAKNHAERYASMQDFASALIDHSKSLQPKERPADGLQSETNAANDLNTTQFAGLLAAISSNVESKVERAVRRADRPHRLPLWSYLAGFAVMGLIVLFGILFFIRKDTVTVIVNIPIENIHDPTLSFILDDSPIAATAFAAPIELTPGHHELVVNQNGKLFKRFVFEVGVKQSGPVVVQDETPTPPGPEEPAPVTPALLRSSPLDQLNAADIPEEKLNAIFGGRANAPPELVAIYPNIRPDKEDGYHGFDLSSDGKLLANGIYPWDIIELRNLASGKKFKEIGYPNPRGLPFFMWVKFAPDGKTIFGLRKAEAHRQRKDEDLYAFAIEGRELWRKPIRSNWSTPALSPDGATIIAADVDVKTNALHAIDAKTGETRASWPDLLDGPTCRLQFTPDGETLVVASATTVKFVSAMDGKVLQQPSVQNVSGSPEFSVDRKKVYSSFHWQVPEDYCVEIDVATGKRKEYHLPPTGCRSILPNPVFPVLVTSDNSKTIHFWDAELGPDQNPHAIKIGCPVERYLWTPEGRYLVIGGDHGIMILRLPVERKVADWKPATR